MIWVTRARPKTDRVACPWLIKRFIDPDATIVYAPREEVLKVAECLGAKSFDAEGADYGHRDGKCTFEVLIDEFDLGGDEALAYMAKIIHGADVRADRDITPESRGLLAIAEGFHLLGLDDYDSLQKQMAVYDALYRWCQEKVAAEKSG